MCVVPTSVGPALYHLRTYVMLAASNAFSYLFPVMLSTVSFER